VEEAGVRDFVVELAGPAERLFGFGILLEGGLSGSERLPLLGVVRVGFRGAVEEGKGGNGVAFFEEGYALVIVG
jgi:hypothetical protein